MSEIEKTEVRAGMTMQQRMVSDLRFLADAASKAGKHETCTLINRAASEIEYLAGVLELSEKRLRVSDTLLAVPFMAWDQSNDWECGDGWRKVWVPDEWRDEVYGYFSVRKEAVTDDE